jgi:hypothetical protein
MSRWFAATVLTLMLSCYGLAVFAQGLMGAGHPAHAGADMQACATTSMSLSDAFVSDAMDLADELPSHDEAGSEHVELVDARHPVPAVLFLSEQPARPRPDARALTAPGSAQAATPRHRPGRLRLRRDLEPLRLLPLSIRPRRRIPATDRIANTPLFSRATPRSRTAGAPDQGIRK